MIEIPLSIIAAGILANNNADIDVITDIPRIRDVVARPVSVYDGTAGINIDCTKYTATKTNAHTINIAIALGATALVKSDIVTVLVEQTGDLSR